jgi:LPS-assembly protein
LNGYDGYLLWEYGSGMSDVGSPDARARPPSKARLFAGALGLTLFALSLSGMGLPASAQNTAPQISDGPPRAPDPAVHGPAGPDGLSHDELLLEADSVTRDETNHKLIARGNVQARYQDRTLRGQELEYDTISGLITANGKAQVINADGSVDFADHMVFDGKLRRTGVATGFSTTVYSKETKLTLKVSAATAVQRSETITELNKAIFTPCDVCAKSGPIIPTWSIQADKVVDDKDRKLIFYRHAIIRVKGIPVLYAPLLWTPDSQSTEASGFFPPKPSVSRRRGFSYEQPYLWVISPSQNLEISPQINTKLNPFLNLDYRKRFYSGQIDARVGYTYEADSDSEGHRFGAETSRSYILATGAFKIDDAWRWGFSAERTSDPTLFDRYDIANVYENRGLFDDDQRRLTSQLYAVRQDDNSFLSVSAISFQSLRPYINPVTGQFFKDPKTGQLIVENDRALPTVAPLIEGRWEPTTNVLGGRLRITGSAVSLTQDQASLDPCGTPVGAITCPPPPSIPGVDQRRITGQADWRWSFVTNGLRIDPYLNAREDAYNLSDVPGTTKNLTISRSDATAGADFSYPLVRRFDWGTMVIEPIVQIAVSPSAKLDSRIPNEDSLSFTLDEASLFSPDKFTGFDIYEGGARVNTGVRATADWGDGGWAWALIGRSFRTNQAFPVGTVGLNQDLQDWVVAAEATPIHGIVTFARADIDDEGSFKRAEAGINWNFDRAHGFARYFKDDLDPFTPGFKRQDAELATDILVTHHWGFVVDVTRDLDQHLWRRSEIGILYQDDCTRAELVYQRNETGLLGPTDSVFLRLSLATLGNASYKRYDDR